MAFVFSSYSTYSVANNGDIILLNSFAGSAAKIDKKQAPEIMKLIQGGMRDRENKTCDVLIKHGFFIDESIDERKLVKKILDFERTNAGANLTIMPHENCNFRCTYCYEDFARNKMTNEVVSEIKNYVKNNIAQWPYFSTSWFGGEPLLALDVVDELSREFISQSERQAIEYSSGITTNGFFLTKTVGKKLLDLEIDSFQITLDGPSKIHNQQRPLISGRETYDKVYRNILELAGIDSEFSVVIRVNFTKQSTQDVDLWLKRLSKDFTGDKRFSVSFHPIWSVCQSSNNSSELYSIEDSEQSVYELMKRTKELGFSLKHHTNALAPHGNVCYASMPNEFVIGSDGSVYKCTVALNDRRNKLGNIINGQFELDNELKNQWEEVEELQQCQTCWYQASCQSRCCPLATINNNGFPPCPANKDGIIEIYNTEISSND